MLPIEMEMQFLQQKEQSEIRRDMREIEKVRLKSEIAENIRIQAQQIRRENKERADERKRGMYETVEITQSGEVRVVTKNLSVPTIPRIISNIQNPKGEIIIRYTNPLQKVFLLSCRIGEEESNTYFKGDEIGNGTYVLKRMNASGINIWGESLAKKKKFAVELLNVLFCQAQRSNVADSPGWIKTKEGSFLFVEENALTWEYLLEVLK